MSRDQRISAIQFLGNVGGLVINVCHCFDRDHCYQWSRWSDFWSPFDGLVMLLISFWWAGRSPDRILSALDDGIALPSWSSGHSHLNTWLIDLKSPCIQTNKLELGNYIFTMNWLYKMLVESSLKASWLLLKDNQDNTKFCYKIAYVEGPSFWPSQTLFRPDVLSWDKRDDACFFRCLCCQNFCLFID